MVENIDPIVPEGTPLPTPPVGVPPYPITPFAVWTWDSPVIPSFYWNIYSAEQRVKLICKEIGKIEAYLNYLVNKTNENLIDLQQQITVLDTRLTALEKKLAEEVARLDTLIAKLREDLTAETQARQDADTALDTRITSESTKLHTEISTEKQNRIHADDQLHTEIAAEAKAREDADTDLEARVRADLATETQAREAGDSALGDRITSESEKLHGEISKEVQDRTHADDALHNEISTETQARQDADSALEAKLTNEIAKRLLPTEVTAGEEISITQPDPSSNRIVIASTVAHSISGLETEVSGVKAALEAEVSERRAEDSKLWNAVNQRIERGKILAGEGISVVNDPDASTVTISSTGSADLSTIEAKAEAAKNTADAAQATATGAESKAEQALTAAQGSLKAVAHTASLSGNGTTATPLALTPATATTLGGVKIGSGLAVTSDGVLSATSQGGGTGIAEVSHDETLKGTGSSSSPLAVNYGSGLKVSGGKLTAEVTQAELNAVDGKATAASTAAQEAKTTAQEAKNAAQGSLRSVAVGTGLTGNGTSSSPLAVKAATASTLGGVKPGAGLKVDTQGTLSTTTTGLTKVAHGATLNGDGTSGHPLEVRTATESEAGVLTEARVRELGASGLTEVAHDESLEGEGTNGQPLRVAPGTKERIGGVKEASDGSITIWDDGGLIPRKVTPETEKADEEGMVSKDTIKSVASTIFDEKRGIETGREAGVCAKVSWDVFGFNENGEIALCDRNLATGKSEENLPSSYFTRAGEPAFLQTVGMGDDKTCFYFFNANFEVKEKGSSAWEAAKSGAFEAYLDANQHGVGSLNFHCTHYGASVYAGSNKDDANSWSITAVRCSYSLLTVLIEAKPQS